MAASGPCDPVSPTVSGPEAELVTLVNQWRAQTFGVPAMELSAPATWAAQWFAEEMVAGRTSGHVDRHDRTWPERLVDCGYDNVWAYGSGEALAGFGSSDPSYGSTPQQALAVMADLNDGHQNGVDVGVRWECVGVGYAENPSPLFGELRYAWVIIVAQYPVGPCPQSVTGEPPETPTPSPTPTATATPTPAPAPAPQSAVIPNISREVGP